MINFDDATKESIKQPDPNWSQVPDHPYKILIYAGSVSGKSNALINLINQKLHTDKFYLYAKNPYKGKYHFVINKREGEALKHCSDSKAFERLNDTDDIYKNIEQYNPNKQHKIQIAFDDMNADILSNKIPNPIVTELFIRGRKLDIYLDFMTYSYFSAPKNNRLNSTHRFIVKVPNKRELQQVLFNHSSGIGFKNDLQLSLLYLLCLQKKYCKIIFTLVVDTTVPWDNHLPFRKTFLERI